ncbi:MAG: hypothetical protein JST84_17155 [Acidobacteria bacterium]|nr:hypothetical protein [Acidobacteriota bacterium]
MPWLPKDKYIWDSWFAWKGGELHAFYLQANQADCQFNPEARHNLASVGHAILTRDGWQENGTALRASNGDAWDNLAIWTGCVIAANDRYLMFYTARRREDPLLQTPAEWQRPQQIGVAVSDDLSHWTRTEAAKIAPVIPNPGNWGNLDGVAWRDPYVMQGEDGRFYAFICARQNQAEGGGVIAYVTSPDLQQWNQPTLIKCLNEFYQMEVPQVFWRRSGAGKYCYVVFCAQEKDGTRWRRESGRDCVTGTYYLQSRLLPLNFNQVPEFIDPARLLVPNIYAGKLLKPETDEHPTLLGFQWADEAGNFVGGITDPIKTSFAADGSMQLRI